MNISQCSGKVKGDKVFFEELILQGDQVRNEAWAVQQQSLDGYKPKHHGFFEFRVVTVSPPGSTPWRELRWWCFAEKQDEETLAPFRKIEADRHAKEAEELKKKRELEEKEKTEAQALLARQVRSSRGQEDKVLA